MTDEESVIDPIDALNLVVGLLFKASAGVQGIEAAMHDGLVEGCRLAVLKSSEMGHRVYERLGFTDFCQFEIYARAIPD